ncbi:MAG: peptidoglycan editing factor PgeF [Desulfobulbaceae bacterium]|nr:peptidoglycan editing factor PgeF [Desulfobulbaceae bacterium]
MLNRKTGVSKVPYDSLNISYGVGDSPVNVTENRRKIKKLFGIRFLVSAVQVHSDRVYTARSLTRDIEIQGYDALITSQPGVGLLIQQADCQAILLHDPGHAAVGAIHCGWRGNVVNIIETTVARMRKEFGTDPTSIRAVISPSLGPCCGEFIHFRSKLPRHFQKFSTRPGYFDFRAISRSQLIKAGLLQKNIQVIDICTVCNSNFFSYRRSQKNGNRVTGRQGSVICLE